jgi:cation transport protein ChaC
MFDGWETEYGCAERKTANLPGYRRAFNKRSVKNWGTKEAAGLTLNLEAAKDASCRGVAFRFASGDAAKSMLDALDDREACEAVELPVTLEGGRTVPAFVYIYNGKNLLDEGVTLKDKVAIVAKAKGRSGANRDYVRQTFEDLKGVGIDDPVVTELWKAVKQAS